ncbi:telomeric repeat-binding factor 2-interacting protein 1 isoform X2 [Syngnathoides biaculeatus]|uniref:telomeric repeat-binding factor 2-interacting protein 1 isoform X2 n=1 Tax=Syngnathoides biaculeatus TaxID=300417 RepID=UPI002ADDAEF9|nr:telomeric repeat-binding factor 2-interacting protein 1 isoform X2 [Syngnathoides biaculeatus]
MMASKEQDVTKYSISPVLFMTLEGEPLAFYLRPGPLKRKLQPLIKAGGGIMCGFQTPGAILLSDPEEKGTVSESTAHWYVSIQFINDCAEKNELLNLEDYRMKGGTAQMRSPNCDREAMSHAISGGRQAYSPGDDVAILNYVRRRKSEIKGNRLWQQMEKERVTAHSWQSMKAHYKSYLAQKLSEDVEEVEAVREDAKIDDEKAEVTDSCEEDDLLPQTQREPQDPSQTSSADELTQNNEKAEVTDSPSCEEDAPLPQAKCEPQDPSQKSSADELTQIDTLLPAEKGPLGDVQVQTSVPPQQEEILNLPGDEIPQAATPEAEICGPSSSEKSAEGKSDQLLPKTSSQNEQTPESTASNLSASQSDCSTCNGESQPVCVPRHSLHGSMHTKFDNSEQLPYTSKLRSAASVRLQLPTPPSPRRTRSALSSLKEETGEAAPPCKRAKGESLTETAEEGTAIVEEAATAGEVEKVPTVEDVEVEEEAESQQEDVEQPPATPQAGPSHVSPPKYEPNQTKRKKRKRGIIMRGIEEFLRSSGDSSSDSSSCSSCDSTSDSEQHWNVPLVARRITSSSSIPQSSEEVFHTPSSVVPESLASVDVCLALLDIAPPEGELGVCKTPPQRRLSLGPSSPVRAASKAHVDHESSDEEVVPPERVLLEEDKWRIRELMNQTNQDLVSVTKALLKTSGDFLAASRLLSDPASLSVPIWNRQDDGFLLSGDPADILLLQEKYGEEDVTKRMVFLNVER